MALILKSTSPYLGAVADLPSLLPMDLYGTPYAAYGLRKLRAEYSGSAIRVRRSSDDAEQDIGFTAAGLLDTGALTTFAGAGSAFVKTVYNQQGASSRDATQTTSGQQPAIVESGVLVARNTVPAMRFDNEATGLALPVGALRAAARAHLIAAAESEDTDGDTGAVVSYHGSNSNNNNALLQLYTNYPLSSRAGAVARINSSNAQIELAGAADKPHGGSMRVLTADADFQGGDLYLRQDAEQIGTDTIANAVNGPLARDADADAAWWGRSEQALGERWFGGWLSELWIFNNDISSKLEGLERNILSHVSGS